MHPPCHVQLTRQLPRCFCRKFRLCGPLAAADAALARLQLEHIFVPLLSCPTDASTTNLVLPKNFPLVVHYLQLIPLWQTHSIQGFFCVQTGSFKERHATV